MRLARRGVVSFGFVSLLFAAGCSSGTGTLSGEASGTMDGDPGTTVSTPSMSYPVPEGCPTAEEFGQALVSDPSWVDTLNAQLLDGQLSTALPTGGCAYATREVGTSKSSSATYRSVIVAYFRLGESGRLADDDLSAWGEEAGGVRSTDTDAVTGAVIGESDSSIDLPDDFSGWTGSTVSWVDGENSWFSDENETLIPEFTQGASGLIRFGLDSSQVDAIVSASANGVDAMDQTIALANGLRVLSEVSFDLADEQGYTAHLELQGKLDPFTAEVEDSVPGYFEAVSSTSASGRITNTTAGRNTKTPVVGIWAVYPLESAACMPGEGIEAKGPGDESDGYSFCLLRLASIEQASLAPDETMPVGGKSISVALGDFEETGSDLEQLNTPISFYALFGGNAMGTSDWTGGRGCASIVQGGNTWAVVMNGWPDILCQQ